MVDTHALSVATDRKQVSRLMRRASLASMSVAIVLVVAKGAAWLITDSVAMLSSLREEGMVGRALDLGARDYVVKPVLFQQLHECVERLASQPPDPPTAD